MSKMQRLGLLATLITAAMLIVAVWIAPGGADFTAAGRLAVTAAIFAGWAFVSASMVV